MVNELYTIIKTSEFEKMKEKIKNLEEKRNIDDKYNDNKTKLIEYLHLLEKDIKDNTILEFDIDFKKEYHTDRNSKGFLCSMPTGENKITINYFKKNKDDVNG